MSAANTLDITLRGKEFRVACRPEEKDDLLAVVAFLEWKMGEIAKQTKSTGERLAVMTALNLAHELINLKEPASSIDAKEAKRRIAAMEARLDAALAPQEKLF
ncbi:MAG TPA: cell division protein ZapA [Rhodocyclaceae bacterium]|nr:cell division protein ZapA [Rhodocyclaceae bacterium]